MEHIIQFGVTVDDDAIVKRITENAQTMIVRELKQEVVNKLFEQKYYGRNSSTSNPLSEYATDIITEIIEDVKDDIVNRAAEKLADKMSRMKAVREIAENTAKEAVH